MELVKDTIVLFWTVCEMTITVSHFIELAITIRRVSVSGGNDRKNESARTSIDTKTIWNLYVVLQVASDPAFLRSAVDCEKISGSLPKLADKYSPFCALVLIEFKVSFGMISRLS